MSAALTFLTPPPGLEPLLDFTLDDIAGAAGVYSLQSAADDRIRLFVLDAGVFLPEYSPEISDVQGSALDLTTGEDAMVLVVANPGGDGTTVNLLAPIVVNSTTGRCVQVILDDQAWSMHERLTPQH
ncbi:flagellar assembly protein FliW [Marisediminicola antarctica]|uniref:Flagellar assembly protein FliW n=1 Tax=Marisediminicola antarctica TaxID=674079 RepID=A0A7L5AE66_9MICO|nr:flagellar assembly protein FliW [Marisediminicola antarctica]QHO68608.1 hypothetical protein BHD05_02160 [Marisediminicola antarctica]